MSLCRHILAAIGIAKASNHRQATGKGAQRTDWGACVVHDLADGATTRPDTLALALAVIKPVRRAELHVAIVVHEQRERVSDVPGADDTPRSVDAADGARRARGSAQLNHLQIARHGRE